MRAWERLLVGNFLLYSSPDDIRVTKEWDTDGRCRWHMGGDMGGIQLLVGTLEGYSPV
jgi:hypothetical protein